MADGSMKGQWTGRIQPDQEKLMRSAKLPEHKKLLLYAIQRLREAHVVLDLNADSSFDYIFDDGFAADHVDVKGQWKATKSAVILTHGRGRIQVDKLPIIDGGKHITTNYNDIDGVPIIFSRN